MNGKKIVFYEDEIKWNNKKVRFTHSGNFIYIRLDELKQSKSTLKRFFENEISSVPILNKTLSSNTPFIKVLSSIIKSSKSTNNHKISRNFRNISIEFKLISDYIDADIYERSDKISVELYNKIKTIDVVRMAFTFSNINLFETNRLEFVEYYYQILLVFFAIIKVIKSENPSQIIILPSVNNLNKVIITSIAKHFQIQITLESGLVVKRSPIFKKYRLLIERLWYWSIWKVLNPRRIKFSQNKQYSHLNLIFAHYKNHYPALIQVLKAFKDTSGILNIIYTPHKLLSHAVELIGTQSIKNVIILPHVDKKYSQFKKFYEEFKKSLKNLFKTRSFADISIENVNLSRVLKISFLRLHEKIINSFRYLTNIQSVLSRVKPSMVIFLSGNDAIDVLATRVAEKKNIPSLFFPHAMFSARRDHDIFEQNYVICAGEKDKEYFISLGTKAEKIHTFGLPLYDPLYEKYRSYKDYPTLREEIINEFSLASRKKIILLVTTHDEDFVRERVFKSTIDLIKEQQNYELIVKIHPVEEIEYYEALAKKYHANKIIILKKYDLHKLIFASDVVIGRSSGAQIEAILLNKDVINLSYEATKGRQKMDQFYAAYSVYKAEDLPNAVTKVLNDKETKFSLQKGRENYSKYILYKFDGKASMRIRDFIKSRLS